MLGTASSLQGGGTQVKLPWVALSSLDVFSLWSSLVRRRSGFWKFHCLWSRGLLRCATSAIVLCALGSFEQGPVPLKRGGRPLGGKDSEEDRSTGTCS